MPRCGSPTVSSEMGRPKVCPVKERLTCTGRPLPKGSDTAEMLPRRFETRRVTCPEAGVGKANSIQQNGFGGGNLAGEAGGVWAPSPPADGAPIQVVCVGGGGGECVVGG